MARYTADGTMLAAGRRLQTLIRRGLKVQERLAELSERKKKIETELLGIIAEFEGREATDPVELRLGEDVPGTVSVKWRHEYIVDETAAMKLKKKLGEEEFNRIFSVKTTISRARGFGAWMRKAHGPTLDKLKAAVEGCVEKVTKKTATISWNLDAAR